MLIPTKIIQPVDSLISISATTIEILKKKEMNLDDLLEEFNFRYYKKITIEKLMLSLDFLFLIDKVGYKNETITIKF